MLRVSLVAQRLKCLLAMRETRLWSLGLEDPLEKEIPTPVFFLLWRKKSPLQYSFSSGERNPHSSILSPLEKEIPTPVFLPWKSHGRRSLLAYSPWGRKESDMTEQFHFHCHPIAKVLAFVYLTINYGNNFLPLYYVHNTVFHYHTLEGLDCFALNL